MKEPVVSQSRTVYFQLDHSQYLALKDRCAKTTCRSLAEYLRKLATGQPVKINHRNASLEDLITELSLTRGLLADALEAFEDSIRKVSDAASEQQAGLWLKEHQKDRETIVALVEKIHQHCKKTALVWLQ